MNADRLQRIRERQNVSKGRIVTIAPSVAVLHERDMSARVLQENRAGQHGSVVAVAEKRGVTMRSMESNALQPGYVYYLADPRSPRWPRYIGATSNPDARAVQHAKRPNGSQTPALSAWKDALRANGLTPLLVVVAGFEYRCDAFAAEWRLLVRWRRRGLADLNSLRDARCNAWNTKYGAIHARRAV